MRYLLALVGVLVVAGLGLIGMAWVQLTPLEPAAVPERTSTMLLPNVTIIEPGSGRRPDQTIRIEQNRIAEVRDATDSELGTPARYVIPGLIDAHVHQPLTLGGLPDYFALLYLKHGVTSVRYTGHSDTGDKVEQHGQRIEDGVLTGPRVFSCGPMIDGDPPLWSSSITLTDPNRAQDTVSRLAQQGVDCIKAYGNLQPQVLSAVVAAAREHELRVLGHVPVDVALEESGIDDVQHLIGVPERNTLSENGNPMLRGWDTLTDERIDAVADYSIRAGVAHTPTLVFLWTNAMRDRHSELIEGTDAHLLPRLFRDVAWLPQASIRLGGARTSETQDELRAAYRRALEVVGRFHERGVLLQAGTDTANPFVIQGAALIQEIELLATAGLDNESALAAATTVPGRLLGLSAGGWFEPGAPADLVVLRNDPVADLGALGDVETVIADGRPYSAEFLDAELRRYQQHHRNFTWDTLLPLMVSLMR